MTTPIFNRDSAKAHKLGTKDIPVDGLGTVRVRKLSQLDLPVVLAAINKATRDDVEAAGADAEAVGNLHMVRDAYPVVVTYAVVDADGEKVYDGPGDALLQESIDGPQLLFLGNEILDFWEIDKVFGGRAAAKNSAASPSD